MIFIVANCERNESNVVIVPAPAIKGNAQGTIDADELASSL